MSQLEKENLEAHVDLCAARYQVLEEKLTAMATRMDRMENSIGQNSKMLTDMAVKIEKNVDRGNYRDPSLRKKLSRMYGM